MKLTGGGSFQGFDLEFLKAPRYETFLSSKFCLVVTVFGDNVCVNDSFWKCFCFDETGYKDIGDPVIFKKFL